MTASIMIKLIVTRVNEGLKKVHKHKKKCQKDIIGYMVRRMLFVTASILKYRNNSLDGCDGLW